MSVEPLLDSSTLDVYMSSNLVEPRGINFLTTSLSILLPSPLVIRTYILRLTQEVQFLEAELADLRTLNSGQPFVAVTSYSANSGSHGIDGGLEATSLQPPPQDTRVLDNEVRCACMICGTLGLRKKRKTGVRGCSHALDGATKLLSPALYPTHLEGRSERDTSPLAELPLKLLILMSEQP